MSLCLVRHAKAGNRSRWDGPDDLRPLTESGRVQAEGLSALMRDMPIAHIVSSPYVRCRQTVEPLAELLRLPVALSDALAEGASALDAFRLAEKFGDEDAVLCTHGDVLGALLDHLVGLGVALGPEPRGEKGSTWVIDVRDGKLGEARYLPPPT